MSHSTRSLCWILLLIDAPTQAWFSYQWSRKWGFWGGIWHWIEGGFHDPLQAAVVIDFVLVIALVGIWLLRQTPARISKRNPLFLAWCFLYLIWPSLGILTYCLWIHNPPRR